MTTEEWNDIFPITKKQTLYIPVKPETIKEFKNVECEDCRWVEDSQYTCTTCWCEGGNGTLNVMDCFKKQEGFFFTEEQLKPLQDIINEGYDSYEPNHHLVVQRWLKTIENFFN